MATSFKRGFQEGSNNGGEIPRPIGAEAQNVRVIVLARAGSGELVLDECGPDARDFIGGNAHTDARSADQDAPFISAAGNGMPNLSGDIRIVHRLIVVGAEIVVFEARLLQQVYYLRFEADATMVTAYGDAHFFGLILTGRYFLFLAER
jgi:hypothetical protein